MSRAVADDHPIALLQTNSLPALVQRELERMILAGDLAAGAQLREAEVAALLGVSRGPVREAFRALEESGLVRLEKNRGVFVRQIGVEEADEIFELRAVLDEFAGRRAAQNATPAQATRPARPGRSGWKRPLRAGTSTAITPRTWRSTIASSSSRATEADALYRRLVNELHLYRRAALGEAGILPVSMREHRMIVEHIAARPAGGRGPRAPRARDGKPRAGAPRDGAFPHAVGTQERTPSLAPSRDEQLDPCRRPRDAHLRPALDNHG